MPDIPLVPPDDPMGEADLARLLAGDDRSNSAFSVFVRRVGMFTSQPLNLNEKHFWGLFYERLRNPGEVLLAVIAGARINAAGIPMHHGLIINLDIEMFPSFFDAPDGQVPLPEPDEPSLGGHQLVLLGVDMEGMKLDFDHLFSLDWGRRGRGCIGFDYLEEHTSGAIAVRAHGGPDVAEPNTASSEPAEELGGEHADRGSGEIVDRVDTDRLEYLIDHYREGEPESNWLLQHEEDDVIWMGRRVIGAGNGDVWIQAALLLRGVLNKPILVGWMFGRLAADDLLDVEEFFVWPPYRGRGLGTALAGRTLLYATASRARWVRWIELADDALVNPKVGTRTPSWASDFKWVPPDDGVGWGVERMTTEIEIAPLLTRLGNLHAPGGAHLLWTEGVVHVAPHEASPAFGLVIKTDVSQPPAAPETKSSKDS